MNIEISAKRLEAEARRERQQKADMHRQCARTLIADAQTMRMFPGMKLISQRIAMAEKLEQQAQTYIEAAQYLEKLNDT